MFTKSTFLKFLLILTILIAFFIRLSIYTQSRDLFIDEANVARNIFEKNYLELTGVLEYEQFAPPLFLGITKAAAQVFGYHEMALRLFPFICSLASVFLLVYLIHILIGYKHAIYPLALFASGFLFLRYGTELKQYSSDFMLTLVLLIAVVKSGEEDFSWKQVGLWIGLGSISVWLSMPSVFVLFSIGMFWLIPKIINKDWAAVKKPVLICGIWLVQFVFYYFLILQDQISSDYLQNYHAKAFLNFDFSVGGVIQNLKVLSSFISQSGGDHIISLVINSALLFLGVLALIQEFKWRSVLIILPLTLLILAALLHKYALVSRLILFAFPLIFLLYAYGTYFLFNRLALWAKIPIGIVLCFIVLQHQELRYLSEKLEIQEIHYALDKLESDQLLKQYYPIWIHHGAIPAFTYYTEISSKQNKYTFENQTMFLDWDTDYNSLLVDLDSKERVWILLSNYFPEDEAKIRSLLKTVNLKKVVINPGCQLFQIEKK